MRLRRIEHSPNIWRDKFWSIAIMGIGLMFASWLLTHNPNTVAWAQVGNAVNLGYEVGFIQANESFTAESVWVGEDDAGTKDSLWLAVGTSEDDSSKDSSPYVTLSWVKKDGGFFPTKCLRLAIGQEKSANDLESKDKQVTLYSTSMLDDANYTALLSIDQTVGLLHIAIYKNLSESLLSTESVMYLTSACPVAVHVSSLPRRENHRNLWLFSGSAQIQSRTRPGFRPIASRVEVGEANDYGTVLPLKNVDYGEPIAVRIRANQPMLGEYRVFVESLSPLAKDTSGEGPVLTVSPIEEDNIAMIPAECIPIGPAKVTVKYVQDDEVRLSQSFSLTAGKAEVDLRFTDIDSKGGEVEGLLCGHAASFLPGVSIVVTAEFTRLDWNFETREYEEVSGFQTASVIDTTFDRLLAENGIPFTLTVPQNTGTWRINCKVEASPQIQLSLFGMEETFCLSSEPTDFLVAVADQASKRILVVDPGVEDWDMLEAVKWSWYPNERNGFSGFTQAWGNPSGMKLRRCESWGGEWMVVVDSKGLAAIVPYPRGDFRKWAQIISGNLHSVELLPNGNIAVAASTGGFVRVYTSSQGPDSAVYTEYSLPGAHGVLWDPKHNLLWALGDDRLIALEVGGTLDAPMLKKALESPLPTFGGHDLAPVYGNTDRLWVTTVSSVYQYEKSTDTWLTPFLDDDMCELRNVKGVGNSPSGRIVFSKPKAGTLYSWTTDTIELYLPKASRIRTDAAFYKVRVWNPDYQ
ncbi:MAG: DUF6528 family protein [Limnochordia bacterium]|nr:DUF6528 family protein [Limnochordia bacterium]